MAFKVQSYLHRIQGKSLLRLFIKLWYDVFLNKILVSAEIFFSKNFTFSRQLQMFLSLMETNPGVLPALGPRFALIAKEIERLEKMEELKVWST